MTLLEGRTIHSCAQAVHELVQLHDRINEILAKFPELRKMVFRMTHISAQERRGHIELFLSKHGDASPKQVYDHLSEELGLPVGIQSVYDDLRSDYRFENVSRGLWRARS